eukprot:CAMPEP_0177721144 /NCGR_PEP_ID=MMETSP0484_2-20121128/16988_1 /TAXON_ID=354590 /ORGANISM="Rhodomonas lens, Strain RHODO" /LENGTH=187 /DNA_ID=CAMNT_0019233425 /DNA_START=76 /DNA_END=641 /DNA_ORIENTATION=-
MTLETARESGWLGEEGGCAVNKPCCPLHALPQIFSETLGEVEEGGVSGGVSFDPPQLAPRQAHPEQPPPTTLAAALGVHAEEGAVEVEFGSGDRTPLQQLDLEDLSAAGASGLERGGGQPTPLQQLLGVFDILARVGAARVHQYQQPREICCERLHTVSIAHQDLHAQLLDGFGKHAHDDFEVQIRF